MHEFPHCFNVCCMFLLSQSQFVARKVALKVHPWKNASQLQAISQIRAHIKAARRTWMKLN